MPNPILLEIPEELFSERLVLKMPRAGHQAQVFEAIHASLQDLERWMHWLNPPPTLEELEIKLHENHARFLLRESLQFEIFLHSSDTFIGRVSLVRLNWQLRQFEIGYWLDSRQSKHGYMTEAVSRLTEFALATLQAKRVEIRCDTRNIASRRVAEKAGFTLEGILKNHAQDIQDKTLWIDDCVYARVPK
jgi:ribosomal-protein-serine acetyltransferase